jgi:hypothetical protein
MLLPPFADVVAASQETPSKAIIATNTQSTITRPRTSAAMTFSTTVFSMEIENRHVPLWQQIAKLRATFS